MIPLTLREIARATGGRIYPEGAATEELVVQGAILTDSREIEPGDLYVARRGEHADGHDYLGAVAEQGAVAALTNRVVDQLACIVHDEAPDFDPTSRVDRPPYDAVTRAFAALGRLVHDRCAAAGGLRVVGITGSSGKTSTKDLMAHVAEQLGTTISPQESFNSEVGVPLTVCRLTADTHYLVAEMGASGIGHIEHLTAIAPPQVAIVLNVGSAHLGEFGSREAIAQAKAELVRALPPDGLAVLNADDPVVAGMAALSPAPVLFVGRGPAAQVRAEDVQVDSQGHPRFTLRTPEGASVEVCLQLVGEHHVDNALAVAATAHHWGMSWAEIAQALGTARARSRWRMEVTRRADGLTLVNDAYNANPDSMAAALRALAALGEHAPGQTVAVLGGMLELGPESEAEHARVGELAAALGVDHLVAVGDLVRPAATAYTDAGGAQVSLLQDRHEAQRLLESILQPGDVALFKSSRDSGMRLLGDALSASLCGQER